MVSGCSAPPRDAAAEELNAGPLVIDVRTAGEFESGHIEGAAHIPYDDIGARIEELTGDKDRTIILYCQSGRRAGIARDTLIGLGYTDVDNAGGIGAYRKALGQ
jgi:phage shock protein E